jgi:hypothetical protein
MSEQQLLPAHTSQRSVCYLSAEAEAYGIYLALAVHSNLPVDMIEEDTLTAAGLAQYSAVVVAQPNLPAEGLTSLLAWVRTTGGTLLTTSGAAAFDRYNTPVRSWG